jgi:hypothetical protein
MTRSGGRRWLGRPPLLTGSELVCLAVAQVLLGCESETRWLRFARAHLAGMFPYLPQPPGYNKRLRAALPLIKRIIQLLAVNTGFLLDNVLGGAGFLLDNVFGGAWPSESPSASRPWLR